MTTSERPAAPDSPVTEEAAQEHPEVRGLDSLGSIAEELGASSLGVEARAAAERLAERRFFVACIGQFKRGKSTLLNALVDVAVLPMGVPPVTTALTLIRHGEPARAQVRFPDGGVRAIALEDVGAYIDERRNPENEKGVTAVEVFLPAPLLASGLCLVDTPGLGSVFGGNTAVTRAFLPQIDAALVVLGTDPPITGEEAEIVERVAQEVGDRLVVVLNKVDRASPAELESAKRFTLEVIEERLGLRVDHLFEVSARERLEGGAPTRDWTAFAQRLSELARTSGGAILVDAGTRAVRRIGGAVLREIAERQAALRRPLEETEARVAHLRRSLAEAGRSLADLSGLFASTEVELGRQFEAERRRFLERARPSAARELREAVSRIPLGGRMREAALDAARRITEREVRTFLHEAEPLADQLYQQATERFVRLANDFLARMAEEPAGPEAILGVEPGLHEPRHFFFTSLMSRTSMGPLSWLADRLDVRRVPRVTAHASAYLATLLDTNSMRVEYDLKGRVLESRRFLEAQVHRRLEEAVAVGERALGNARERQSAGAAAVAADLRRLDDVRIQVERALGAEVRPLSGGRDRRS